MRWTLLYMVLSIIFMNSVRGEDGSTWYQIKFPISGADGWVRSDFIQAKD